MKHLLVLILLITFEVSGQQYYPIFTQNYSNPYLVNPSFLTLERRAEVNAIYRQQWTGISNAPKTIQFDIQYPLNPRVSLGVNAYNDKTILLSSSGLLATFGYKVRLASNQLIGFGLSGGFVSNQIDLDDVPDIDLVDPVLLNATNNFEFDSQFGLYYSNRNFIFGVSLLKLVDNRPFSENAVVSEKFDPFKDRTAFMSYRFNLSEGISASPTIYYRNTYSNYEYFEGALLINYKDFLSIGGGYRMDLGPHAVIRFRVKNLKAGYAYDFPANQYGGSTGGTNEIQIKFQFNRVTEPLAVATKKDTTKTAKQVIVQSEPTQPVKKDEEVIVENFNQNPVTEEKSDAEVRTIDPPQTRTSILEQEIAGEKTYHLVVGVFARKIHADRYAKQLSNEGFETEIKTRKTSTFYYVTLPKYQTKAITLDRVLEIRNSTQFKDAWFEEFD